MCFLQRGPARARVRACVLEFSIHLYDKYLDIKRWSQRLCSLCEECVCVCGGGLNKTGCHSEKQVNLAGFGEAGAQVSSSAPPPQGGHLPH